MGSLSKRVQRLGTDFGTVESGDLQHRKEMAARLDERLGEGAGSAATLLVERVADRARTRLERLEIAERSRVVERGDLTGPRLQRDEHATAAYQSLQMLRGVLDSVYGRPVTEGLGLVGTLPRDPWGVFHHGRYLIDTYDKEGLPVSERVRVDIGPTVETLRGQIAALEAILGDLGGERCQAESRLCARNGALGEFVDAFTEYKGLSYALLTAAGLDEAARRLRPKRRKRRARGDEQEPSEKPTGT